MAEGAEELAEAIKQLTSLTILNIGTLAYNKINIIGDNQIGERGLNALIPGIKQLKSLTSLDICTTHMFMLS